MQRAHIRKAALIAFGIILAVAGCKHKPKDACAERTGDGFCVDNAATPASTN